MKYATIVFLQGDAYREFEAILYPDSSPEDLERGVLLGCRDEQAALEYLTQWDNGDHIEPYDGPGEPWGTYDDTHETEDYVMTYHVGMSYAALQRKITEHYHVGSNVPGYLPESDVHCFNSASDAVAGLFNMLEDMADDNDEASDWLDVNTEHMIANNLKSEGSFYLDVYDGRALPVRYWVEPAENKIIECEIWEDQ